MSAERQVVAQDEALVMAGKLARLAREFVRGHDAETALRFLFELDARLYTLQGETSVAYGGGVHTKHRHLRYHDFFVERIRAGERVLDVGCGDGTVARDVAERTGATVVAIDIVEAKIAAARAKNGHSGVAYVCGDATRDLPAGIFDAVILSNVLEHIEERPEFLRAVRAAARPGRWLVRVPLFERDWRVPLKRELGLEWRLDPTHFTEYTQESFAEEVAAAGLEIVEQQVRWGEIWCVLR